MSARDRTEAHFRAMRKGSEAFWHGEPIENCPYKKSLWGNGTAWEHGWREAEKAHQNGLRDSRMNRPQSGEGPA